MALPSTPSLSFGAAVHRLGSGLTRGRRTAPPEALPALDADDVAERIGARAEATALATATRAAIQGVAVV